MIVIYQKLRMIFYKKKIDMKIILMIKFNLSLIAAITEDELIGYQVFEPSVLS